MKTMKIAKRVYYCPMCGHDEVHETNHQGEIYCPCKACGSSPLYCREIDSHAGVPFITAILHAYRFNIENPDDKQAYSVLCDSLKAIGFRKFKVLTEYRTSQAEASHDGEKVKLFNPDQWPDQYVSNIGRLHQWKEGHVPNPSIKAGYYLEL